MAELVFNDERIEARAGETLLSAARRNGSHIWFLCDGRGICQTCTCRVLAGGGNLKAPTELERAGLGEEQLRRGYRLGCQADVTDAGPVSVESVAEDLRRRAWEVAEAPNAQAIWDRLLELNGAALRGMLDIALGVAATSPSMFPQLLRVPPTPARVAAWTWDGWRLAQRLWTAPPAVAERRK